MIRPVLLVVLPLLIAFLSVMFKKQTKPLLLIAVLINAVVVFVIDKGEYIIGNHMQPYGIVLNVDNYSLYALIVLNVLFALLVLLNLAKITKIASILMIALGGLNGLLMTGDLFNLFVFLEISAIAAFMIVATNKKLIHVFNYMIIGIVGSVMYLFGVILLYSQYGTLNMNKMAELMTTTGTPATYIPIIMIFGGLAVETKLLPFNGWVKGVLGNSDSLVGPMIGSIYSGVMLIVFGRLFTDVFVLNDQVRILLSVIAIVTLIAGEVSAFSTMKLREILLYSSVAQSGLAVLLFLNGYGSIAVLVVFANVLAKIILFMLAGVMTNSHKKSEHTEYEHILNNTVDNHDDISTLAGIFVKNPLNGVAFSVASLSLASLPLFFGFFVKINVLYSMFLRGDYVLPAIILATSLVEGAYIIRMLVVLWNPGKEGEKATKEAVTSLNYEIDQLVCMVLLLISLSLVALGISPDLAIDRADEAGADLEYNISTEYVELEGGKE